VTPTIVQTAYAGINNVSGVSPLYVGGFSNPPAAGNAIVVAVLGIDITNTLTLTAPSTPNDTFTSIVSETANCADSYGNTAYTQSQLWLANFIVGGANSRVILINGSEPNTCGLAYIAYEISGLSISPIDATAKGNGLTFPAGAFNLSPVSAATLAIAMINAVADEATGILNAAGPGWTLDTAFGIYRGQVTVTGGADLLGLGPQHQTLSSNSPVSCALSQPLSGNGWLGTACALRGIVPPPSTNNSGFLSPHVQIKGVRH
jgi:hypothetical protein